MADWFETHIASIAASRPGDADASMPVYETTHGALYHGKSEEVLKSSALSAHVGKVQLVMTSPPFPLNTKKAYGNRTQDEYVSWFADFAPLLREMVTENGSIVIEIGNAWMPDKPVMSTHVLKAFLAFLEKGDLHLCQEFIWYNPARLPSPVEWVNIERSRVKDAFTYAQIVDRVVALHPGAKTSARSVVSTAAALRKGGTEVPKRQPAPTAKAVSEDPAHGA